MFLLWKVVSTSPKQAKVINQQSDWKIRGGFQKTVPSTSRPYMPYDTYNMCFLPKKAPSACVTLKVSNENQPFFNHQKHEMRFLGHGTKAPRRREVADATRREGS